jgi:predicted pyridoxine 5'-phosphate oxidase superfamily flavin-nucleotide-binding protein
MSPLDLPRYRARLERAFVFTMEGYDWNCPQHITPRFTEAEIEEAVAPLHAEIARLSAALREAQAALPPRAK